MAGDREIAQFALLSHVDRSTQLLVQPGPRGTPMFRTTTAFLYASLSATDVVTALGFTPFASTSSWSAGGVESLGTDLFIDGTALRMQLTLTQNYVFSGSPSAPALPTVETGLAAGKWWNNGGVLCVADGTA